MNPITTAKFFPCLLFGVVVGMYLPGSAHGDEPVEVKMVPTTPLHFRDRTASAVGILANGITWAYLTDTKSSTGLRVPQLYFTGFPFGANNYWNAPVLFNFTTDTGNNRAVAIRITDTSKEGPLAVTGLQVAINSPPVRGGDSSGIYVMQSGGGNGISVYKHSKSFPNNGFAIEAGASGKASGIYARVADGIGFLAVVTGNGAGVSVVPASSTGGKPSNETDMAKNRAFRVFNQDNTKEYFFVQMDGTLYTRGSVRLGAYARPGKGTAYACFDDSGTLFRSDTPCR
jgi:hypothetical protein